MKVWEAIEMFEVDDFVERETGKLMEELKGRAMIACSGGVDSTVAAVLAGKAVGKELVAVHVDTGLMRKGESRRVKKILLKMGLNLKFIDARKEFISALKGVKDPEKKRKIIGEKFIRIFERVARKEKIEYLIQGTIAPDWIESGGEGRDTIKSHHNVGGLPEKMGIKVVEPLRDIYKDEVRKIARKFGLEPRERQPFPGPGLAVRIVGEVTEERIEIVREANAIFEEEIEKAVMEKRMKVPWQYFATLLPVKAVGVQGDLRNYGYVIALRAVESLDGMSANYSKIPHDILEEISVRITNKMGKKVNRVVYDLTNKPPGTIEFE